MLDYSLPCALTQENQELRKRMAQQALAPQQVTMIA